MDFFYSIISLRINPTLKGMDFVLLLNYRVKNSFLSNRYRPTQGDLVVFEAVKKAPSADLPNALRWYNHIASFNDGERQKYEDLR